MPLSTQPYKGTRDFYPEDMRIQRWIFNQMRSVVERFAYQEYDGPMLEPFELYAAKTGEEIVNQQLYWLMDRGERKLAIRPEMTPTLARMVAAKFHELPKPIRWYSTPNLWRYERPQRGRLREHWQLNVDVLGGDPLLADCEIISVALAIMQSFGGEDKISIRINNRRLMDHFFSQALKINPEQALHVSKALDARAKTGDEVFLACLNELGISSDGRSEIERFFQADFKETASRFPCEGVEELKSLFRLLLESGISNLVVYDPTVMRGMDYYTGTVFEMYDISPENRRALFGGGRYDNLVGLFGNYRLPGVGFGMGDVGIRNFLETHGLLPKFKLGPDVFISLPALSFRAEAERLARELRGRGIQVMTPLEIGGFGAQLKLASRHGVRFAILFGEAEYAEQKVVLKDLEKGQQSVCAISEVAKTLTGGLNARTP